MQIMHIIPRGIPPQTARINCRKLAIKSVVLGARGEGHWESKDISLLEPSKGWWASCKMFGICVKILHRIWAFPPINSSKALPVI